MTRLKIAPPPKKNTLPDKTLFRTYVTETYFLGHHRGRISQKNEFFEPLFWF